MEQITKDQHFVPKFYLKRFADSDGDIQVLNVREQRFEKSRSFSGVCKGLYFYAEEGGTADQVSQDFETIFGKVEDRISKDWDGLIDRAKTGGLLANDFENLANFVSTQMLRTDANRQDLFRNNSQVMTAHLRFLAKNKSFPSDAVARKIREIVGKNLSDREIEQLKSQVLERDYIHTTNNVPFLRSIIRDAETFFKLVLCSQWTVHKATGKSEFVTSENPVVEWAPQPTNSLGTPKHAHEKYVAISPDVMVKLVFKGFPDFPFVDSPEKTVRYKECADSDVMVYNFLLSGHGIEFAYARKKDELAQLLKQKEQRGAVYVKYLDAFDR